jgi:hypothetical protein
MLHKKMEICANASLTHATVRNRTVDAYFEVSTGIADTLKAPRGTFKGVIYDDKRDLDFRRAPRCGFVTLPGYVRELLG